MSRKIIIDTDPGIDDTMAIYFALRSAELELIGLTTIFGNVHTSLATTNALRLLEIAEVAHIPVAPGADNPIAMNYRGPVAFVHGDDGQGNVQLPPPTTTPLDQQAALFIIDQVMRHPGEVTLVPIGPLTNLALALRLEPRIADHVHEVVLMGGAAFAAGNASPAAEANILNDPEAADVVFGANWQVTMVGLDVTHRVHMTRAHLSEYDQLDHPMGRHIARILPFYRDFFETRNHIDGIYVHDSSAVAYLLDPSLFTVEALPLRVDTSPGLSRGKTLPSHGDSDVHTAWAGRRPVNICVDVRGRDVVELEFSRMKS